MVNVPIAATRRPRRPLLVSAVSVFAIAGALTFAGRTSSSPNAEPVAATWWDPGPLTSWAYVIGENAPIAVPTNIGNVQVYDIDEGNQDGLGANGVPLSDPRTVSSVVAVHASGAHAICYVDAGTAENWRSDYGEFDPSELGGADPGWPGEEFINVADWSTPVPAPYETLKTIMTNRFELCKQEGFDAVEADNVDAYTDGHIGDFTLTMAEEEAYIDDLVSVAHGDGLAYFLKNEVNGDSLLDTEAPLVDGEINESCWQYDECSALSIFVKEGKPILNVEYENFAEAKLCSEALAFPMATIHAGLELDGTITYGCWQYGATSAPTTSSSTTTTSSSTTTTVATTTTMATTTTTASTTTTSSSTTTSTTSSTTTTRTPTTTTGGPHRGHGGRH
jgi:hypothetical protein